MWHTRKSAQHVKKVCVALGKVRISYERRAKIGKMRHTWKSATHLEKCGALEKKAAHLE